MRRSGTALGIVLVLLLPAAVGHTAVNNETFVDPSYFIGVSSGPTSVACETFQERIATQGWGGPGTPAGPGAGPTHPMHTPGVGGGAIGWHQAYMMRVARTVRTDHILLPGVCGIVPPWVSSLHVEFLVFGGGTLQSPNDLISIQVQGDAATLASFAGATGATIAGGCGSALGGGPVAPSTLCSSGTLVVSGAGTHDLHYVAHATNPGTMVPAASLPSITAAFRFNTAPVGLTPGGPHTDRVDMTLPF